MKNTCIHCGQEYSEFQNINCPHDDWHVAKVDQAYVHWRSPELEEKLDKIISLLEKIELSVAPNKFRELLEWVAKGRI